MRKSTASTLILVLSFCLSGVDAMSQQRRSRPIASPNAPQRQNPSPAQKQPVRITTRNRETIIGNFIQADTNIVRVEVEGGARNIQLSDVATIEFLPNTAQEDKANGAPLPTPSPTPVYAPKDYIRTAYDEAKDETYVVALIDVYEANNQLIVMGLESTFKGRTPPESPRVKLSFISDSTDWHYDSYYESLGLPKYKGTLRILVNGSPLGIGSGLGSGEFDTIRQAGVQDGKAIEKITTDLDGAVAPLYLRELSKAQRMDIQLLHTKFQLPGNAIEVMREFIRLVMKGQ